MAFRSNFAFPFLAPLLPQSGLMQRSRVYGCALPILSVRGDNRVPFLVMTSFTAFPPPPNSCSIGRRQHQRLKWICILSVALFSCHLSHCWNGAKTYSSAERCLMMHTSGGCAVCPASTFLSRRRAAIRWPDGPDGPDADDEEERSGIGLDEEWAGSDANAVCAGLAHQKRVDAQRIGSVEEFRNGSCPSPHSLHGRCPYLDTFTHVRQPAQNGSKMRKSLRDRARSPDWDDGGMTPRRQLPAFGDRPASMSGVSASKSVPPV